MGSRKTNQVNHLQGQDKTCPSCNDALHGKFCHQCGEKQFSTEDLAASRVANHALTAITDIDGKWWRTIKQLLKTPGALTVNYLSGIRKQFLTPFQLLLFCSIKFFLVAGIIGYSAFTTPLKTHLSAENFIHQKVAQKMVENRLSDSGENASVFEQRFNETAEFQARSLVMLMVPLFGLVVLVLHPKQSFPVVSSLVFATHVFAFMLFFQALIAPLLSYVVIGFLSISDTLLSINNISEVIYSSLMFMCFGAYYYFANRRVYKNNTAASLFKMVLFSVSVYWVFLIYRMVLFFTTFHSI